MEFLSHFLDIIFLLFILVGPVPLCLAVINYWFGLDKGMFHNLFLLILGWCILSTTLALLLGNFSLLSRSRIIIAEIIYIVIGSAMVIAQKHQKGFSIDSIFQESPTLSPTEKTLTGIFAIASLCLLWFIISTPIHDYDSLSYHLPNMAQWYQEGHLQRLPAGVNIRYYPYHWEVLSALFLFAFRSDFLVGIPNWLAWLLSGLSITIISMELGAEREKALIGAGLVLFMPIFYIHTSTMHVDLAFSAFVLAGLGSILLFVRNHNPGYLVVLFTSIAMLVGIKMSGLPYAVLLLTLLAVLELRAWQIKYRSSGYTLPAHFDRKSIVAVLTASIVLSFFLGSYWYIQNIVECGNPLGILQVHLGPYRILPLNPENITNNDFNEFIAKTSLGALFDMRLTANWNVLLAALKENGDVGFIILVTLALLQFPGSFLRRVDRHSRYSMFFCYGLLITAGIVYWYTPYSADNGSNGWQITPWIGQAMRFAFPFFSVLGVSAACSANTLKLPRTLLIILLSIPMVLFLDQTRTIYEALVLLIISFVLIQSMRRLPFLKVNYRIILATTFGLIIFFAAFSLSFVAQNNRFARQDENYQYIYTFLEKNTSPGEKIGFLANKRSYLLYGKNLDRWPIRVGVGQKMNQKTWLKFLREQDIRIVAIGPGFSSAVTQAPEYQWLKNTNHFLPVHGEDVLRETVFYKLIP